MKAIIDENGALMVKRGPNWKIQYCQQDAGNAHPQIADASKCGDHCPHFREEFVGVRGSMKLEVNVMCCHHAVNFKIEGDDRVADSTDDSETDS